MNVIAISVLLATWLVIAAQDAGWQAKPDVVERNTKQRPDFNYDEAAVKPFELPDALATAKGHVRTSREWTRRRAQILELFRTHVYGRRPGKPQQLRFETIEEKPAMDGAATLKRIAVRRGADGEHAGSHDSSSSARAEEGGYSGLLFWSYGARDAASNFCPARTQPLPPERLRRS